MRLNKFIAQATGLSRRAADEAIKAGRVSIDGKPASLGTVVKDNDRVTLDNSAITPSVNTITIMLNKPIGYITSREGQGSKTVYDLLPKEYHTLKPVGRLDKDSSGLLLLTNDGELANKLTHPKYQKEKLYEVKLNKNINTIDENKLLTGVGLNDGMSKFIKLKQCSEHTYEVTLAEGRNRQIRRTFNALGYKVDNLHRIKFGSHKLGKLSSGLYKKG